jgi:hypothetical protein
MSASDRTLLRRAIWVLLGLCLLLDCGIADYLLTPHFLGPDWRFGRPPVSLGDCLFLACFVLFQGCLVAAGLRLREPAVITHI